jgi:hypothetical protein
VLRESRRILGTYIDGSVQREQKEICRGEYIYREEFIFSESGVSKDHRKRKS